MKIEIAVYTAQEGYSWQPGTKITGQELKGYKACIGKFPSPDAEGFPFGGVFLKDDKVVFYRYHVAKKIDFRGRDALYCVLGVLPKAEAAQVDPKALFALPEFVGVVKPFPTQAEVPSASSGAVPEWLKNLDFMSLDVRITGSQDDLKFEIKQEQTKVPEPSKIQEPAAVSPSQPSESVKPVDKPAAATSVPAAVKPPVSTAASALKPRPWYGKPFFIVCGIVSLLGISILVAIVLLVVSLIRGCGSKSGDPKPSENPPPTAVGVSGPGRDARPAHQAPKPGIADALKTVAENRTETDAKKKPNQK